MLLLCEHIQGIKVKVEIPKSLQCDSVNTKQLGGIQV